MKRTVLCLLGLAFVPLFSSAHAEDIAEVICALGDSNGNSHSKVSSSIIKKIQKRAIELNADIKTFSATLIQNSLTYEICNTVIFSTRTPQVDLLNLKDLQATTSAPSVPTAEEHTQVE